MVTPTEARPGHSLPELIVAVTFLATTLVAVGGMAVLGGRWTVRAVAVQEAVRVGGAVLDSLVVAGAAGSGAVVSDGFQVRWDAGEGARIRVEVATTVDAEPLVVLEGEPLPRVPVLPDVGAGAAP
ncbi:MAG: hypothetical protein R6U63_01030 [Longimicrobiales bacterium]